MSNVRGLIAEAYYLSGVLSRKFEQPSGGEISDGLVRLNDILAEKAYEPRAIPFRSSATLNCVAGQEEYLFNNFTEIESLVYFLGTVRIPLILDSFGEYFNTPRVESVRSIPSHYYAEKEIGRIRVYLYFSPAENYQLLARGKQFLTNLALDTDLDTILDDAYQSYLKYELAIRLAQFNKAPLPGDLIPTRDRLQQLIFDRNPVDVRPVKNLALTRGGGMNWAVINISKGWVP